MSAPNLPYELLPDNITQHQLEHLKTEANTYGYNNGLLMFDNTTKLPFLCPFTLLPRTTPTLVFNRMWDIHQLMQELYAKVATSHDFLLSTLKPMTIADPFLRMLVATLEANKGRIDDPICLISRSDYMIHENDYTSNTTTSTNNNNNNNDNNSKDTNPDEIVINNIGYTPLQVEFNSMSTGFASLSQRVNQMHRYLLQSHPIIKDGANQTQDIVANNEQKFFTQHNGPNGVAAGLASAVNFMATKFTHIYPQPNQWVVIMVVQPGESNVADQRLIEYALLQQFNIRLIRATLREIESNVEYNIGANNNNNNNNDDKKPPMWCNKDQFSSKVPIALFYYRSCYTPRDFNIIDDNITQESRELINVYQNIEKTNAIKCPNIGLHLAGTKKIQQILTQRDVLKQFIPDDAQCDSLLATFTKIYSLQGNDLENNQSIIQYAIQHPDEFVLKPMREGGGNNYYGDELKDFFLNKTTSEINAMILMQRINPNVNTKAILMRKGESVVVNSISEYGIFGGYLGFKSCETQQLTTLHNDTFGSLIRIKAVGVNEGGVAAGFSCLSSPILE